MATYKVLQDIEAEDKLIGPLTLKQFIFAGVFVGIGFLQFLILTSGAPVFLSAPLMIVLAAPMALFGFLAAPISQDQPNDIWLLARLRYWFKPRKRIWSQDGVKELVTITAPKKEVHIYTKNLSQTEVRSRLQALANTVDSRGWAIKNVNTNLFSQPSYLTENTDSDRLIDPMSLPQEVPAATVTAADDMLDEQNNPVAQHLDQLVQEAAQRIHNQAKAQMQHAAAPATTPQDYWFLNQPSAPEPSSVPSDYAVFQSQPVVTPGGNDVVPVAQATPEEEALASKIAEEHRQALARISDHMKNIQPLHNPDGTIRKQPTPPTPEPTPAPAPAVSQGQTKTNPAIIGLANNDDLNVATIARQAKQMSKDDGEVVISLH